MHRRLLGSTGIEVSVLGLGTVKLGRDEGVKYPQAFVIPDDAQATRLIDCARDLGINLIDTAPAYGNSEERLGHLLRGQRQDWVICSKAGEEFAAGESLHDFAPQVIRASVERSLRRLHTDYLDIVLLHSDGSDLEILNDSGALEELHELCRRGLVRACGLSGKTLEGNMASVQRAHTAMVALTPQYQNELPVAERAAELGKAVLLKKVFSSGHAVSDREGALRLALNTPGVASAIIGTIDAGHLTDNAALAERLCAGQ